MTATQIGRRQTIAGLAVATALLIVWHTFRNLLPEYVRTPGAVAIALLLLVIARWSALSARELGLERRWVPRGLLVGAIVCAILLVVMVIGANLSSTRGRFDDARADVSLPRMLLWALVEIPLGTVLLEELAFRGVFLALLRRLTSTPWAVVISSVLFGLWHITGSTANPLETVVATTVAGVVFCVLRLWSHSLLAPMLAHVGTNSFALAIAWVTAHY